MKGIFLLIHLLFLVTTISCAQQGNRKIEELRNDWLFKNKEVKNGSADNIDEESWQKITVPHDWAIAGPFSKDNDPQKVKVTEDGDSKEKVRIGRTGGLPYIGVGWYRKHLLIPKKDKGKNITIEFDGAMSHAQVYLNDKLVGEWPYGYSSFSFDITSFIKWGEDNVLAVRLENFKGSARWYPGAGIYRSVRLVTKNPISVAHWGTYITTPKITKEKATVNIKTTIANTIRFTGKVKLLNIIYDDKNNRIAETSTIKELKRGQTISQNLNVANPKFWSAEYPTLYYVVTLIKQGDKILDRYKTNFGIRSIEFSPNKGMLVNGIQTKIKGVCLHDDLGPLGTAFNKAALMHHLKLLKQMGCNAIRGTHNPHAPEMLELCDEMGFYFIDEAFDEWKLPKVENGYHKLFDEWAKKDLEAMIRRDRNHPALIMYSIGNEIREANFKNGGKVAAYLADICRATDPTRPVTQGFNNIESAIKNGLAAAVDVVGINYNPSSYEEIRNAYPNWKLLASETASTVSSRGAYHLPADTASMKIWPDNQASSYDLEYCSWSQIPDVEWKALERNDYIMGEFVWTGIDYLGEPSPFNDNWPSRSSYFGIIDLAGIPKDRYYLYKSHWSDKKVLHILPHWNWEGKEGEIVPVYVYSNYPVVELFINGKSYGKKSFNKKSLLDSYRLRWENTKYEPGEVKAVAYHADGSIAEIKVVKTAGTPARIVLEADKKSLKADEKDLTYVTVSVVDKDGNICPLADNLVNFKVSGAGFLRAVGNGNPSTVESFQANYRKAFYGKCMAIIQSNGSIGELTIEATSDNLKPASLSLSAHF